MRKRIRRKLVCYATGRGVVQISKIPKPKRLHVKVFGEWKPISEVDLPMYEGFQTDYL